MTRAIRYHDFSAGHRVYGHENKCAMLHGHNYRVHFHLEPNAGLDSVGRVVDFSVIKSVLCEWLELTWDHRFLIWEEDPLSGALLEASPESIVLVPFNPTAENMAEYLVERIAPPLLIGHHCTLVKVEIEETRKCSVSYETDV